MKKFLLYQFPPLAFMFLIFYLSSIPNLKIDDTQAEFYRRKTVHLVEYAILWFLIYRGITREKWLTDIKKNVKTVIASYVITVLYGLSDELHQFFVPTRTFKFTDILFDAVGALMGIVGVRIMFVLRERKSLFTKNH